MTKRNNVLPNLAKSSQLQVHLWPRTSKQWIGYSIRDNYNINNISQDRMINRAKTDIINKL